MAERAPMILFLEADTDARRVLSKFLVRWGELRAVETIEAARVVIDQEGPEILIVDPDAQDGDGIELVGQLRDRVPWAQVLVIAASDRAERTGAFIAAGANDVVSRPFDIGTLEGRILRLKEALPQRKLEFERLKQLEARVRHVDAIAMLGTVAATTAHELAGPLSAIMTNADMIEAALNRPKLGPAERENAVQSVQDILLATRVIQEFIARVRTTAKREHAQFVDDSLAMAIDTTRLFLRQKMMFSRVAVQWPTPDTIPRMEHIPTRLTQALTNMVANAIEAAGQGGRVQVRCAEAADQVLIAVDDDGPGLSGEQLKSAVQPFYTTKSGGTGLGLSVINDVVREHGGILEFGTGIEGKGLSVKMVLPKSRTAPGSRRQ